ncbi:type I-B CRISPR-associated protein Cas7/Cst2/DevR [Methanothermobacter thermautotrophicus]|uniref:Type I-B CRISPR-associated protein Cas7/Cst2/DevR n=1 Tax=Methanothermobacter thermautotrophicus TaxID=145262 RepID=A0A842YQU3_METTF|nr:type I-B CRISPR-associated protein Cas7/Cst2/DevR [Methanothermobacter thermautotrophicus]MBE2900303.1 type I-B CRISPR-associated protein Cas7/Cst2/DevR [Methanothermobacter thermautotrophicus]
MSRTFANIGYITKVNIDNLNSSENPGNMVVLKKVQDNKGDYYPYVSGQALRYYLKETMNQLGMKLTKLDNKGEYIIEAKGKDKGRYKDILENHPDLDLLGFMEAVKGSGSMALRRWSPVKVSPLVSIFPWNGNSDLLTRKKEGQEGGDLVKVEINTFNFMKGTIVIDMDVIGSIVDELSYEIEPVIDPDERRVRVEYLVNAIKSIDGGAKKARLLDDLTPKFVVVTRQKAGTPIFLNSLSVNEDGGVNIDPIKEILEEFGEIIDEYYIGIRSGIFTNEEEIKGEFKENVTSVNKALDMIKGWL